VTDEVYKKVAAGTPFREAYAAAKSDFFKRQAEKEAAEEARPTKKAKNGL